jgi:hypothetical protein
MQGDKGFDKIVVVLILYVSHFLIVSLTISDLIIISFIQYK